MSITKLKKRQVPTVAWLEGRLNPTFAAKLIDFCEKYEGNIAKKQKVTTSFRSLLEKAALNHGAVVIVKSWSKAIRNFIQDNSVEFAQEFGISYNPPKIYHDFVRRQVESVVAQGDKRSSNLQKMIAPLVVVNGKIPTKRVQLIVNILFDMFERGKCSETQLIETVRELDSDMLRVVLSKLAKS